jgi:hypothetical protein
MGHLGKKTALYLIFGLLPLTGCKLFGSKPQPQAGKLAMNQQTLVPVGVDVTLSIDGSALGRVVKPGRVDYIGRYQSQTFQGSLQFTGSPDMDMKLSLVPGASGTLIIEFHQEGMFKLLGVADNVDLASSGQSISLGEYVAVGSFVK